MRRDNRIIADSRAFTLIEVVVVVAIIGIVAGIVVVITMGTQKTAEAQTLSAELAEIRKACLRFRADMGEPPQCIAELLQSPDPSDARGGWWWRTDSTPPAQLRAFDPATGRGWNGPYLKAELISTANQEAEEAGIEADSTRRAIVSDAANGRFLSLLLSNYSSGQRQDGERMLSHYQLDFSDEGEIYVRFVVDPLLPHDAANVVAELALGIRP